MYCVECGEEQSYIDMYFGEDDTTYHCTNCDAWFRFSNLTNAEIEEHLDDKEIE